MSNDPASLPPPAGAFRYSDDAGDSRAAADARVARAEERLVMLRELAEIGMAMTRKLGRRVLEAPDDDAPDPAPAEPAGPKSAPKAAPGPRHDPAESFARLSRAVRLTLAFEAKTDEQLADLRAGGKDRPVKGRRRGVAVHDDGYDDDDDDHDDDGEYDEDDDGQMLPPAKDYPSAHRNVIRDRVHEAINAEVSDVYRAHEVLDDLYERLTEGDRYDALVNRPLRETVEAICEDLGLNPDWSRWTGEGWLPPPPEAPRYVWQSCWAPGASRPIKRRRQ
jgi:hypothetical protein